MAVAAGAGAQIKELVIPRASASPVIDGGIADAVWQKAVLADGFLIAGAGGPAQQQTTVRVLFTGKALHFAFDCDDTRIVSAKRKHGGSIWYDDSIEVYLSPELRPDIVHQFILNVDGIKTWRHAAKKEYGPGDSWQGATRQRPGGWTAEIEIPYESFLEPELHPRRGDLWGLKLTRMDYAGRNGRPAENSSWTAIAESFHDASAFGDLVFESRNLLANGSAEKDEDNDGLPDGWTLQYESEEQPAKVRIDRQTAVDGSASLRVDYKNKHLRIRPQASTRVRPGTTYKLSVKLRLSRTDKSRAVEGFLYLGGSNARIKESESFRLYELYCTPDTSSIASSVQPYYGEGTLWLDDMRLAAVRDYMDPDTLCLTGNATGTQEKHNVEINGAYTYYEGHTSAQYFPYYPPDKTEPGRSSGWVSFRVGKLTDGNTQNAVSWPHWWMNRIGVDVELDLREDYLIKKVEIYSAASSIFNCRAYLKPADSQSYVEVFALYPPMTLRGQMQNHGYINIRDLDAVARKIRLNLFIPNHTQISEIKVWGRKPKKDEPLPLPRALVSEKEAEPLELPIGQAPACPAFPIPQESRDKTGSFVVNSQTKIVVLSTGDKRSLTTAEVLRDEIRADTGLEVSIRVYQDLPAGQVTDTILIGEPGDVDFVRAELKKADLTLPQNTPGDQGYALDVSPDRVLIAGCSAQGTFYGCMSLLQMIELNAEKWRVPCVGIRDWPDQEYRMIRYLMPDSQDLTEETIRTLARCKITHIGFLSDTEEPVIDIVPFADRYHVGIFSYVYYGGGEVRRYARKHGLIERYPGETQADLDKINNRGQNPCPSHPKTWEIFEKTVADTAAKYNSDLIEVFWNWPGKAVWGARWNECPRCRARNMQGHEMLAFALNKIHSILAKYDKRPLFFTTLVCQKGLSHAEDKENDWTKAQDLIAKDIVFMTYSDHEPAAALPPKGFTLLDWQDVLGPPAIEGQNGVYIDMKEAGNNQTDQLLGMLQTTWSFGKVEYGSKHYYAHIEQQIGRFNAMVRGIESPLRRSGDKGFFTVDIKPTANRSFIDDTAYDGKGWIDEGPGWDLRALKPGHRVLAGVPFEIISSGDNDGRQCVMLHNRGYFNRSLPDRVTIPVNQKAASLIFLHALDRTSGYTWQYRRKLAGYYAMVYEDGACDKLELNYHQNIANWDKIREEGLGTPKSDVISNGYLAWAGTTMAGKEVKLYATEWVNPCPDRPVERIIFMTTPKQQPFNPVLLAVTGTEPGQRDIDLWRDRNISLSRAEDLAPQEPTGKLIDLSGGINETGKIYLAPDGTRVEFDPLVQWPAGPSDFAVAYQNWPGNIITENNWGAANTANISEEQIITVTLPQPRELCCIGIFGRPTPENLHKKPGFIPVDYRIEVSPDGEAFRAAGGNTGYIPEEQGWRYHRIEPQAIKEIAIRVLRLRLRYNGIACVRLYEPE